MTKTILGVFTERDAVEFVVEKLRSEGFDAKDVSIVMRDKRGAAELEDSTGTNVAGGAASGITTGALLGGLAGLVAAFAVPAVGAFFIGGPLATALGLTGAAASTVSGAATGAVAGGLIGGLMGLGLSDDEAKHYESRINEGAILVAVPVNETNEAFARDIFADYNATDVKTVSQSEEKETIHTGKKQRLYADMDNSEAMDEATRSSAQSFNTAGAKGGTSTSGQANPIEVQKYLKGIDYPCSRNDLLEIAKDEGASDAVLHTLEQLPDQKFSNPREVSKAIGSMK